jgi:hypothetical protein
VPISTTAAEARARENPATVHGQIYLGREYIGAIPQPGSANYGKAVAGSGHPQAYLVMQPPGSVTPPHFHTTNQFQVFVDGGGRVGKLRADPVMVQYAGAHTPYGPIAAEDQGIQYFTLRQAWDSGAKYLPDQRRQLAAGQQRQVVGTCGDASEALFSDPDGLHAEVIELQAGEQSALPDAAQGGGQYHVVLSGTLMRDDRPLEAMSVEFAFPDEGEVAIQAGTDGLRLLLARFPMENIEENET